MNLLFLCRPSLSMFITIESLYFCFSFNARYSFTTVLLSLCPRTDLQEMRSWITEHTKDTIQDNNRNVVISSTRKESRTWTFTKNGNNTRKTRMAILLENSFFVSMSCFCVFLRQKTYSVSKETVFNCYCQTVFGSKNICCRIRFLPILLSTSYSFDNERGGLKFSNTIGHQRHVKEKKTLENNASGSLSEIKRNSATVSLQPLFSCQTQKVCKTASYTISA